VTGPTALGAIANGSWAFRPEWPEGE